MTKTELITKVAEEMGATKKETKATIEAMEKVIGAALAAGEEVKVLNGLTLKVSVVPERTGTIQLGDRKGETYVSPEHKTVKAKVGKALKDAVL